MNMKRLIPVSVALACMTGQLYAQEQFEPFPAVANAEVISVTDESLGMDEKISLPSICSEIRILNLPLPDGYTPNSVWKVESANDKLFVFFNSKMLCYDRDGRLLYELGKKSDCPESPFDTGQITLRADKQEIYVYYLVPGRLYTYSFSGELKSTKDIQLMKSRKDIAVTDDGIAGYSGYNVGIKSDGEYRFSGHELEVVSGNENRYYLPFESANNNPAGYGGTFNFSETRNSYTFHYLCSDTVYSIGKKDNAVRARYLVNFGENSMDTDFRKSPFAQKQSPLKTGYIEHLFETDGLLYFTYRYGYTSMCKSVFYSTSEHRILHKGVLSLGVVNIASEFVGLSGKEMFFNVHKYDPSRKINESATAGIEFSNASRDAFNNAKESDLVILIGVLK